MKAYVVAPSAEGAGTRDNWLPLIEKYHIALTGYYDDGGKRDPKKKRDKHIGHRFALIEAGSLIILANGKNSSKACFYAGFAEEGDDPALAEEIGAAQVRHLRNFTSLSGEDIPFSTECKFGDSAGNIIDSCYELDPDGNRADLAVVDKVLSVIAKAEGQMMIKNLANLLKRVKQVVLTGAPGTGKTYLARQVAMQLILGKPVEGSKLSEIERKKLEDQMGFVQFHPSFDYTDFVEGLRPIRQGADQNLSFVRKDGIFKSFCKRAILGGRPGHVDNFEEVWSALMEELMAGDDIRIDIPNVSNQGTFPISLNEPRTGIASRTYKEDGVDWIRGSSKFFTKEQLYNVYRGMPGVPSKGHDNYRRAIIAFLKKNYGLKDFHEGKVDVADNKKQYVFIIDEINRGDISKIFGELFFAMDKGYRGKNSVRVKTQYDNLIDKSDDFYGGFYVPDNVYIIGTMNDIDRNVESMDFAIRRRFTWKEIHPSDRFDAMWSDISGVSEEIKEEAQKRMLRINRVITDTNCLGSAFQIGPSYFRELVNYKEDTDGGFQSLWDNHIEPLVREYLRGILNADATVKIIKNEYMGVGNAETVEELDKG